MRELVLFLFEIIPFLIPLLDLGFVMEKLTLSKKSQKNKRKERKNKGRIFL